MWQLLILLLCIFQANYAEATYNAGIKTRVYEQRPITHSYYQHDHRHHGHHQPHSLTRVQHERKTIDKNEKDYQAPMTYGAGTDRSYQQEQREGGHYQENEPVTATLLQNQQPSSEQQPIYERKRISQVQITGNWQNTENSINEYYTGCPSGHTGQLPYAYDCRRFLNCWHGKGHIQTCSVGTVFNPETLECDRPDKVKCEAALSILGVQSAEKSPPSVDENRGIQQPNYRAGRFTDKTTDNVEVLCPAGAEGLQPHPSDCTRFVNCANGNMHIQECGPGTAYSIPMKVCDFKAKVDCTGREGGEEPLAARQACPTDASGLHPNPYDCTKFLHCTNGGTFIHDCGPGTAFDSVRLLCDYTHKAKCCSGCAWTETESTLPTPETIHLQATTTSVHSTSNGKPENLPHTTDILCLDGITGYFPYPFDYTKFINCKNGNTAIQNCAPGTAFSISSSNCESLDLILPSDHVMYIVSQVTHEYARSLITCPPGTDGVHLYPFNAELFVKCIQSQMQVVPCTNAQVFSAARRSCLPASQVLRHERVRLLGELQQANSYAALEEQSSTYPHPFDSTKYLRRIRGQLISESCGSGKVFSLSRKGCNLKEETEADDYVPRAVPILGQESVATDMGITQVDKVTYFTCPRGFDGYFLHPFDCTRYLKCSQGSSAVLSCLGGTVFSISRRECVPRDKVEPYDRVEYMTTTNNEFSNEAVHQKQHDLGISCNPGTFGIYPHPHDSQKYIRCANGRIAVENCAAGQVFSSHRNLCYSEGEVDHRDRGSYNRGFSVTQSDVNRPITAADGHRPQAALNPARSSVINPPSTVLNPPFPAPTNFASTVNVNCPPGASGRYPHPFDCTKFLMCTNGEAYVQACAPGTAWSQEMEVCDFKEKVGCTLNGSVAGNTATPTTSNEPQYQCPAGMEGLYQHPYDWHKYLACHHGQTTVMDCAPGTVFSVSRKICDLEANVLNADRCNKGVHSRDYDYKPSPRLNEEVHQTQTAPTPQVSNNRWTNMNKPRPQVATYNHTITWQQPSNPSSGAEPTPIWFGTAAHVDQLNPTHTVIYEEGSLEPNRNYNRPMYSTPLAPFNPATTSTTSTVVYAQPVGSQEDSKELFSNTDVKPPNTLNPLPFPTVTRQNHTRQLNTWTPIRPVDIPRHDFMPAYPNQNTVYTNTRTPHHLPSSHHSHNVPVSRPQNPRPPTHSMPSPGNEDSGQRPLPESEFKINTVSIDPLPGQVSYNLNDLDQLPAGSAKHDISSASNLYGGLQPPLANSLTTTTAEYFLDPYEQSTQIPLPSKFTTPTHRILGYPQLSNATIQTFPHQPHYSRSYSEVAHSRNASWIGRKTLQPSASSPLISSNNEVVENESNKKEDQEATMKAALKLLLKPYIDPNNKQNAEIAYKAQSHIMNLVLNSEKDATITPTTTHKPLLNKNTIIPTTIPRQEDVELILAGEQHSLVGLATIKTGSHETSTPYNLYQSPLKADRSTLKPTTYARDPNSNWHKHHYHDPQHFKLQHSHEFHEKHPNLPNPFKDPASSSNSRAAATTLRTYDADVATGGKCPFDCGNSKCIEQHQVCDGANNCGNRKDEQECEHLGYELRLTGGQASNMGRVEVKILGKWSYVCDDKFGLRDADVVCRELGFKMGAMEVRGNSYYAPSDVDVYFAMDEVECKGNETSLRECDFKGWGVNNCGPDEVVGVVCKVPILKCPDNYWLCSTSKECIPTAFLCDVTPDCEDGSDESGEVCNAPIKYRLEGGRSSNEGRLEVFYRGEWGTVCDDDFGLKEAQVLCNSLGLYGKPELVKNIYGPGSGPIWLDQVSCYGNETKIDECNHWSWGENNCNHTEDVGLKCTAGPKPSPSKPIKPLTDDSPTQDKDLESTLQFEQTELDDLGLYQGLWQRSSKAVHSQKKCGHFKSNLLDEYEHPEERVVNGTIAKRGRHPWQATIRTRGRGGISSHWCGAVIISRKLILTAAHCLAGYPKGSYFVRMGDHYANIAESSEVDSNIENWYIHEKFRDQKHMNNDIALILLKSPVRFNDYVQPICLPEKGATLETNRLCTISGWGSIKSGTSTPSNILRSAQVPILADEVCSQKNVYANAMTEGMFCAGFLDESVDACDGDSGGPLVCSDEGGETLYGIISWGQHCGYANHPGVYVRVERYIDWIYDKINLMMQQGKL